MSHRAYPAARLLWLAIAALGCASSEAGRWELVSLPVERPAFPVDARIEYVRSHPGLSAADRDAVMQGMLVRGMKAEDVTGIAGEPERKVELPPRPDELVSGPVEEWIYPAWSRVKGGPSAPGLVYVSGGVVVDFIAIAPSGRMRRRVVRERPPGMKSGGAPGILP